MSMYGQYLTEKTSDKIIETQFGFATYRFLPDDKTVYIIDIFVVPECRTDGVASAIADEIVEIAKGLGCSKLMGSVIPSNKGSSASLKVLLAYGMSLKSSSTDFIIFEKDI